jgi:chemotaxis family two-component system response regulator Rcp1
MANPTLWLVDDDPGLGVIVGLLCRRAGQTLMQFIGVEPAWQALTDTETQPDLLLLDVNLPGHSGLELLRRMRSDEEFRSLRVALFCQPGLTGDIALGWAAGADYFLAKDLVSTPAAWTRRLDEILEHAHGRGLSSSLGWVLEESKSNPASWGQPLNQTIGHRALRSLGSEVLEQILRRSLAAGFGRVPSAWIHSGTCRISVEGLSQPARPEQVERTMAAFVDQVVCLLGSEAAQTCAEALRAAWTGSPSPVRPDSESGDRVQRCDPVRANAMKAVPVILLVEDNSADVKITQRALRESGLPVELIVVRDGQEAVEYLLRQGKGTETSAWRSPDLILLDINLPRMSGREVLERIRTTPSLRAVPVVVLTTSRREEDVRQMYIAGANTYIEKPQDFQRFVQVLQTIHRYWMDLALLPPLPE